MNNADSVCGVRICSLCLNMCDPSLGVPCSLGRLGLLVWTFALAASSLPAPPKDVWRISECDLRIASSLSSRCSSSLP